MSTSFPRNVIVEPPGYYWSNVMYTALTSTVYTVVAVAVIILLLFLLVGLIFLYVTRVRNKKYSTDDVKYSLLDQHADEQSEDAKHESGSTKKKESKQGGFSKKSNPVTYPAQHSSSVKSASVSVSPHSSADVRLLLNYLENNLKNESQLEKEWNDLCSYSPESLSRSDGLKEKNIAKNRTKTCPYNRKRVKLDARYSKDKSDYINAGYIVDSNPKLPLYISTQCPMENTVDDFWQMVWEREVTVVVNLTTHEDLRTDNAFPYWTADGIYTLKNFEVTLISTHSHPEDIIIRSFSLSNTRINVSRTVTQCQYLKWEVDSVPNSLSLLEFRRTVLRAQRQDLPLLVHCSDGIGRTGTYILIDLELNRLQKGAKELDLAATVEHLRDNYPDMVLTKEQFVFALDALVKEIKAGSEAISQRQKTT